MVQFSAVGFSFGPTRPSPPIYARYVPQVMREAYEMMIPSHGDHLVRLVTARSPSGKKCDGVVCHCRAWVFVVT